MGATGTTLLDFGAFPGTDVASVAVTGQTTILPTSLVEAWTFPASTADHSEDEHILEELRVFVPMSTIASGVGFAVVGVKTGNEFTWTNPEGPTGIDAIADQPATKLYGKWNIGWAWV